jgi:4,5-DOPA dioxygenase extradiol
MLALDKGAWSHALKAWGESLVGVKAVMVLSAHWESDGAIGVTASPQPGILHDFGGFPEALYRLQYPVLGNPILARRVSHLIRDSGLQVKLDESRPLDHGAWVPLMKLFPDAQLPVIQVSLPRPRTPRGVFRLGNALAALRQEDMLLMASGGVVHNLGRLDWSGDPAPESWATAFEAWVDEGVRDMDIPRLLETAGQAPFYREAVPTSEHFDPLYFALGAAGDSMPVTLFQGWQHGNLSLRAWAWNG